MMAPAQPVPGRELQTQLMVERSAQDVTRILGELRSGDESALARLLPLVYTELRALAGALFRGQAPDHTLQPTALVHEAFLRLVHQPQADFQDREHFFRVAAMAMRQLLTDHARRRRASRRGGGWDRVRLDSGVVESSGEEVDLVALDDALTRLTQLDERQGRIVELRFLAGLSVDETAALLGLSARTVELDSRMARAWLKCELAGEAMS
jgi:RNA polymerase sigma factor (TIGR02999 family)